MASMSRIGSYHNPDPEIEFAKRCAPPNAKGCIVWQGQIATNGYGRFSRHGSTVPAHRYAYERVHGQVPDGMELDHLCRNRACVNPAHLDPVSHRENTMRGRTLTAANAQKTHCQYGHPLSGPNLFVDSKGSRQCRTCRLDRQRERTARLRCSA